MNYEIGISKTNNLFATVFNNYHYRAYNNPHYLNSQNKQETFTKLFFYKRSSQQQITKVLRQCLPPSKIKFFHEWLCLNFSKGNKAIAIATPIANEPSSSTIATPFIYYKIKVLIYPYLNLNFLIHKLNFFCSTEISILLIFSKVLW